MTNVKISQLPPAIALGGDELIEIDQGGTSKRATTSLLLTRNGGPQAANTVLAGPVSGPDADPTYRLLVSADLPLPTFTTVGAVMAYEAVAHEFLTAINEDGSITSARPTFPDIIGTLGVPQGGTGAITFTAHGVLLGEGTGAVVSTAALTDGQILVGQTGSDPLPKSVSGDVTLAASGAVTVDNNAITNAKLAQAPGGTIKGNGTGSTANVSDLTVLPTAAVPAFTGDVANSAGSLTTTIQPNVVSNAKLAQAPANTIKGNATGVTANVTDLTTLPTGIFPALTGDVTTPLGSVVTTIGANKVTRGMLAQGVARSVIGVTGNATANEADIQGTANQVLRVNGAGTALAFGAVDVSQAAAVTGILQAASFPALTGDVTNSAGSLATTIGANKVTRGMLAQGSGLSVIGVTGSITANEADIVGTASQVLRVNDAGTSLGFGAIDIAQSAAVTGVLAVANGGTGQLSLTTHGVLIGEGTSGIVATTAMTSGQVLVGQGATSDPTPETVSGDATLAATGALTIANNAVTSAKFRQSVARSVVGNATNATANVTDIQGTANQVLVVNSGGTALSFGAVNVASSAAVTGSLGVANGGTGQVTLAAHGILIGEGTSGVVATAAMTAGQILVGQGATSDPLPKTMSGDATLASSGALTIANSAVTNAKMANMATLTVKSNVTGGSAAPSDNSISAIVDTIGSTQGDVLFRGSTGWSALAPGTAGNVLTTQGASADPSWTAAGSGAPVNATYVTLSTDPTLTNERVLTAGSGISIVDAGAGSTVTINAIALGNAQGLKVTNNVTTPNTQIDVTASAAILTTSAGFSFFKSGPSVTIDLTVNGANGLDTGTKAVSTWYYVYLIYNGTTVAGLASTSATSPTLPSGYTYVYRAGAMETDGSGNLYRTLQRGNRAQYVITTATNTSSFPFVYSDSTGTFTAKTATGNGNPLPTTATTIRAILFIPTSGFINFAPNNNYTQTGNSIAPTQASVGSNYVEFSLESSSVYVRGNSTSNIAEIFGWVDSVNAC